MLAILEAIMTEFGVSTFPDQNPIRATTPDSISSRPSALVFAIIGFVIALTGVLTTPARPDLAGLLSLAMYFTIWTNVAAAILFGAFIIVLGSHLGHSLTLPAQRHYATLTRLAMYLATSLILVTIAYWVLLAPIFVGSLWTFSNLTTHLITPLLLLGFTLLCLRPGLLRRLDVYLTAILPLVYVVAVYIAYAFGYRYHFGSGEPAAFPYFFLDYHQLGWGFVAAYIIGIAIFVIAVGFALFAIDRRRAARQIQD